MKKQIGVVGVDAGLIMVGDPCYFWPNENGTQTALQNTGMTWSDLCDRLRDTDDSELQLNYALGHEGLGVVVGTTHGDGTYPVYLEESSNGRRRLIVELG